jgi:two-component system, OmpR family, sensor kinase
MRRRRTLRTRLTAVFAAAMAVVMAGLGAFLYLRLGAELLTGIDLDLRARAQTLVADPAVLSTAAEARPAAGVDPDEAFAQVLDRRGRIVRTTPAVRSAPMLSPRAVATVDGPTFFTRSVRGVDDPARLLAVPTAVDAAPVVVVVGTNLGDRAEALRRLLLLLAIGGPVAVAAASAAGWWVAGAALRPVERMRREADAISGSEPDRRLGRPGSDELDRLALTLNAMLGRLEESNERERRFIDEASHELRTPVAVLKGELDLALTRPRTVPELEAAVRSAAAEADRLAALADDLLVLARTRRGDLPVRREPVRLRALLEEACARFRRDGDSTIEVDAPDAVVRLDPVRIRQALDNLIDNAVRHGAPGPIVVRGAVSNGSVCIAVEDAGPGFAPSVLYRAFEPFVRTARDGNGARGAGLGLAIVRAVAEAHGGSASASNRPEGGATVTLVLRA